LRPRDGEGSHDYHNVWICKFHFDLHDDAPPPHEDSHDHVEEVCEILRGLNYGNHASYQDRPGDDDGPQSRELAQLLHGPPQRDANRARPVHQDLQKPPLNPFSKREQKPTKNKKTQKPTKIKIFFILGFEHFSKSAKKNEPKSPQPIECSTTPQRTKRNTNTTFNMVNAGFLDITDDDMYVPAYLTIEDLETGSTDDDESTINPVEEAAADSDMEIDLEDGYQTPIRRLTPEPYDDDDVIPAEPPQLIRYAHRLADMLNENAENQYYPNTILPIYDNNITIHTGDYQVARRLNF
jgi:hypothetical protein